MALIQCSECGHEVSDKASTCPNCGCPIEKGLVCSECGAAVEQGTMICPNCGNPLNGNVVNKQNRGKAFGFMLGVIAFLAICGWGWFAHNRYFKTNNEIVSSADSIVSQEDLSDDEQRRMDEARQQYLAKEEQKDKEERGWIYGTWSVNVGGGAYLQLDIEANNIVETIYVPSQGKTTNVRSYYISNGELCTDKTKYKLDKENKRLLGSDGTPFVRGVASSNASGNNSSNDRRQDERYQRIKRLERKTQDDINELNAMVSSGRMNPATLMYIKQNLPNELSELMDYYRSQGNSAKYEDYAYKRRVVLQVLREIGI